MIVNPYATTVSDRLKNLVVYALQGRYEVETVATEAQNHATEIGREVRDHGYDVVVAFGGDGTLNEVANGLAGTDVPVSVLPGGSTNVVCRTLGIPNDVVDATEHLLAAGRRLGAAQDRPRQGRRAPLRLLLRRRHRRDRGQAGRRPPAAQVARRPLLLHLGGDLGLLPPATWSTRSGCGSRSTARTSEGVTALAQNSDPFTYFASRPIRVCEGVEIDDGTLSLGVLKRAAQRDMPTLIPRLFSEKRPAARHRQIEHFEDVTEATIASISETRDGIPRPFPVQVDGDYIGESTRLELSVAPGALTDRRLTLSRSA